MGVETAGNVSGNSENQDKEGWEVGDKKVESRR